MSKAAKYSYYIEDKTLKVSDRPRKFLETFATILDHGSYGLALDHFATQSAKHIARAIAQIDRIECDVRRTLGRCSPRLCLRTHPVLPCWIAGEV